jgi:hypothetical protein
MATVDLLIRNAKIFDGAGAAPVVGDIAVKDGRISPRGRDLPGDLAEKVAADLENDAARTALYADPDFEARFKAMWRKGKSGYSLARLRRLLRLEEWALRRDIGEMTVEDCPVAIWKGEALSAVMARLQRFQSSGDGARNDDERAAFTAFPPVADAADLFFHLLKMFDRKFIWSTVSANFDEASLKRVTMSPALLPGFADSGAHLRV